MNLLRLALENTTPLEGNTALDTVAYGFLLAAGLAILIILAGVLIGIIKHLYVTSEEEKIEKFANSTSIETPGGIGKFWGYKNGIVTIEFDYSYLVDFDAKKCYPLEGVKWL